MPPPPKRSATAAPGSPNRSRIARPSDDHYPTPREAIIPFVRSGEPLPGKIWEPACGDGAMARVLLEHGHRVIATNLGDRGYGQTGVDFLETRELPAGVGTIMTNPPNYCLDEFVAHAIALRPEKVCIFTRLAFLEGRRRFASIFRHGTLVRQYVMADRVIFFAGDTPRAEQPGWSTGATAWFVFLPRLADERHVYNPIRWLFTDAGDEPELPL